MTETAFQYDAVVYIGRFQPYHTGHHALVRQALALGKQVVLVLGSAGAPRSRKNPFTALERELMIARALGSDESRVRFASVPDFDDNVEWVAAVQQAVFDQVPTAKNVALIGHFKDESSYYLDHFPHWTLESVPRANALDATTARNVMFDKSLNFAGRLEDLWLMLPEGTFRFVEDWLTTETWLSHEEFASIP